MTARARATSFCTRFGLRAPILMAPMAGSCPPGLAAAVANGGGMGAMGALTSDPAGIAAWVAAFRAQSNGTFQLNLWVPDPAPVRDADTLRLRGIHRQSWATNKVLGLVLEGVVTALGARGIDVIVLKGAALGRQFYGDPGERPMNDVDLLVRDADVPQAFAVLHARGWVPDRALAPDLWPPRAAPNPAERPIGHGWSFGLPSEPRARGLGLDLHWRAIPQDMTPRADDGFWARAVPLALGQARALTLAPEDHLLHAIAHGIGWNTVPSIRWVADVVLICHDGGVPYLDTVYDDAWVAEHLGGLP